MTLSHLLEDFGDASAEQLILSDQALEEQRLDAFERGYQAGWEDASKAHSEEQGHVGSELSRNLQDLSFTYHEVQTAMIRNLEPLFAGLLQNLLPQVTKDAFQGRIVEELMALAREIGGGTVVISVAPARVDTVLSLLGDEPPMPVSVQPDDSLGSGQAFLRIGTRERMIDLDTALDQIRETVSAFFETARKDIKHG